MCQQQFAVSHPKRIMMLGITSSREVGDRVKNGKVYDRASGRDYSFVTSIVFSRFQHFSNIHPSTFAFPAMASTLLRKILPKSNYLNPSLRLIPSSRSSFQFARHHSTQTPKPSPSPPSSPPPANPTLPSFNLLREVRNSRPAVRYTVYAGLGLMATVESTFWFNVIRANFFPQEKDEAEAFLASVSDAIVACRAAWMGNYGRYYGGYVWGVGER
jgi:hypothetical protein